MRPALHPQWESCKPVGGLLAGVPRHVRLAAGSCTILATLASCLTYGAPYRWIVEMQISALKDFFRPLSVAVTFLVCGALFVFVARTLVAARLIRSETDEDAPNPPSVAGGRRPSKRWPRMLLWGLAPWGLVGVAGGGYALNAAADDKLTVVSMSDLDDGGPIEGGYLEVTGCLVSTASINSGDSAHAEFYTPLIAPMWDAGRPLSVIVRTRERPDRGVRTARGMRWPLGLPGQVRANLVQSGIDAEHVVIVDEDSRPRDWQTPGIVLLIGGAGLLGVSGVCGYLGFRERRVMRRASSSMAGGRDTRFSPAANLPSGT